MKLWFLTLLFFVVIHMGVFMVVSGTIQQPLKVAVTGNKLHKLPKVAPPNPQYLLSFTHYLKTCPDAEAIIRRKVSAWIHKDYTLAASIIRLHFHDCAVRVCN